MKKAKKTLYDTLGVKAGASPEELKAAFRAKAKDAHPDKRGSEDEMKEINKAYLILKDPTTRDNYDKTGEDSVDYGAYVFQVILEILASIIDKNPPNIDTFLDSMQSAWSSSHAGKQLELSGEISKLEKFQARIKKFPANNFIGMFLSEQIGLLGAEKSKLSSNFEKRVEAFDFFREYEFDEIEELMRVQFTMTTGTTTAL